MFEWRLQLQNGALYCQIVDAYSLEELPIQKVRKNMLLNCLNPNNCLQPIKEIGEPYSNRSTLQPSMSGTAWRTTECLKRHWMRYGESTK